MLAEEKETSVIFDETNSPAMVYTWNKAMKKRIKELAEMYPNDVHIESYSLGDSISCTLPKSGSRLTRRANFQAILGKNLQKMHVHALARRRRNKHGKPAI